MELFFSILFDDGTACVLENSEHQFDSELEALLEVLSVRMELLSGFQGLYIPK